MMLFFKRFILCGLLWCCLATSSYAISVLQIENNFSSKLTPHPLFISVDQKPIGKQILPTLPKSFVLPFKQKKIAYVIYDEGASAYLRVSAFPGKFTTKNSAFFSVDVEMLILDEHHRQEKLNVHGYVSHGLAYTWKGTDDFQQVTFCSVNYYAKHGTCFKK